MESVMGARADLPRPVASVAVVTLHNDCVLLVQRGKEPYMGKWSFPGGSVEPGETSREAARREALEETGLEVEVLEVADVIDSIHPPQAGRPGYHYIIIDFLAVPRDRTEPLPATDVSDARWVPIGKLDGYDLTPLARPVLERALRRHIEWMNAREA